ncbi:hypothetical protein [Streptomyces sp. NPDC050428]|uniref:hypothetical protein n=1 Tax=Streptomyces sp. NPDC050428 TaxID=3155757 RepID=UPI00341F0850
MPLTGTAPTTEVPRRSRDRRGVHGRGATGDATVETGVRPPWKKTVRVPLGKNPTVKIVLDAKGGQAGCTLAVRGEHVQRATASGAYGRATCTGELLTPPDFAFSKVVDRPSSGV